MKRAAPFAGALVFEPANVTVSAGEEITWVNNAGFTHNIIFDEDEVPVGRPAFHGQAIHRMVQQPVGLQGKRALGTNAALTVRWALCRLLHRSTSLVGCTAPILV